jgi:hypothetical protein
MAEPAYMRIRHRKEFIPGPITECGEDNLWQIHEFAHEISGFPLLKLITFISLGHNAQGS